MYEKKNKYARNEKKNAPRGQRYIRLIDIGLDQNEHMRTYPMHVAYIFVYTELKIVSVDIIIIIIIHVLNVYAVCSYTTPSFFCVNFFFLHVFDYVMYAYWNMTADVEWNVQKKNRNKNQLLVCKSRNHAEWTANK